jgi:hypothetical protein
MSSRWSRVGDPAPSALADARLQLHHAAQIIASATISYLAPRPDDSHTALTWIASARALATEPITAERDTRIAVRLEDLTFHLLEAGTEATRSFALLGRTTDEAYTWMKDVVGRAGLDPARLNPRKHYTIPDHPVASGAPFSREIGTELRELARYWSNAAGILDEVSRTTPGASAVLTWPHHFDIGTLIALPDDGAAAKRTIGIGQSPGDDLYAGPYWYVGPYPYPATRDLPPVSGGGHWHTTGWFGAALPASAFVAATDQRAQVLTFVDSAVAACRTLLGE